MGSEEGPPLAECRARKHGRGRSETILLPSGPQLDSGNRFLCFVAGPRLSLPTPGLVVFPPGPTDTLQVAQGLLFPGAGLNTQASLESWRPWYLSSLSLSQSSLQGEEMGPRRGRGPVCPHLPWAEMLIWAHLCPLPAPTKGPTCCDGRWDPVLLVGGQRQGGAALRSGARGTTGQSWPERQAGGGHARHPWMGEPHRSLLLGVLLSPGSSIPPDLTSLDKLGGGVGRGEG